MLLTTSESTTRQPPQHLGLKQPPKPRLPRTERAIYIQRKGSALLERDAEMMRIAGKQVGGQLAEVRFVTNEGDRIAVRVAGQRGEHGRGRRCLQRRQPF